jgi:replicative DNA helicase Mcm
LDLDGVILSRFDLWFMMRDEPDEDLDADIASDMTETARVGQKIEAGEELTEEDMEVVDPPVTPEMFRAYIAMAKQIAPSFTDDAADRVVSEYVELRQLNDEDGPIPTTARLVEALHRLSEASARIRLSKEIIEDDVERAIDILMDSLETLGIDPETGELDATMMETGTPSSMHDRVEAVKGIIDDICDEDEDNKADYDEIEAEAVSIGLDKDEVSETVDTLRSNDEIIEPTVGAYRTL